MGAALLHSGRSESCKKPPPYAVWARTSDRKQLDFLRQLLLQKPKTLCRFLEAFEFDEA